MALVLPIEEMLKPIPGSSPCGTLEPGHSAQIAAMRAAIESKPAPNTSGPDWQSLRSVAETLFRGGTAKDLTEPDRQIEFKPIKHLGPAMVLTVAALQTDGLSGLSDGLDLVARLLDQYWDTVYPLRVDDPDEPYYQRTNLLSPLALPYNELTDSWKILERIYAARLIEPGLNGPLSVRDCLSPRAATLKLSLPPGTEITEEMVQQALPDPAQTQPRRDALSRSVNAVEKIEKAYRDKAANHGVPALEELRKVLKAASDVLEGKKQAPAIPVTQTTGQTIAAPVNHNGAITSSQDAVKRLNEVIEYFKTKEKSSPVPYLLERVKSIIDKSFLDVLQELNELGDQAPQGFRKLAGIKATTEPPKK